jgi:hypothetical protein
MVLTRLVQKVGRMERETKKGKQPKHDEEPMEKKLTAGGQYRITCKKCGSDSTIPEYKGRNGSAHCTGDFIYLAWNP